MGRFTKRVIGGLTAALALTGGAFAGEFLLADFDDGTNVSKIGLYYYVYASPQSRVSENLKSAGEGDEYGPVTYKAQSGGFGGVGYSMPIVVDPLPTEVARDEEDPLSDFYPVFGTGIQLTDSDDVGYGPKFSDVTSIKFKTRTPNAGLILKFAIESIETSPTKSKNKFVCEDPINEDRFDGCKGDEHANAYSVLCTLSVADEWKEWTISIDPVTANSPLGDNTKISSNTGAEGPGPGRAGVLKQQPWFGNRFTFDPKNATKLAWAINADLQGAALKGKEVAVFIDDVILVGANVNDKWFVPHDLCEGCDAAVSAPPTPNLKFSDFDGDDPLQNERGYYWYNYTDEVGGGQSFIFPDALTTNEHTGETIMNTVGKGRTANGAYVNLSWGGQYSKPGETAKISPFVGIGANLCNIDEMKFFSNAKPFTGVYFEYKTEGAVNFVNFEVTDDADAIDSAADKDGEVLYTKLKASAEWRSATVPFSKLVLPSWAKTNAKRRKATVDHPKNNGLKYNQLNLDALSAIKFKLEGEEGAEGKLYIDNVYFYGADAWGEYGAVKVGFKGGKAIGLRATYNRGVVGVNWNAAQNIASGKVSLVNVKGRTVATAPLVKAGGKISANLGKGTIPTGMYFVRINAKDVQGKKVVQQVPLSVVK